MRYEFSWLPLLLLMSSVASGQLPDEDWEFEESYDDPLLYLHSLVNYAYELPWEFDWERRRLAQNALRINTGSVASDELLTDVNMVFNQPLNEKWRFQGSFRRETLRQWPDRDDQLLLGVERSFFESSSLYLMVNPEFEKEFIDVAGGYTFYGRDREEYARVGLFLEDLAYDDKNDQGGRSEQDQYAVQWLVRFGIGGNWYLYSEGEVGNGFDRVFDDAEQSPDVSAHTRKANSAQLRLSRLDDDGYGWSGWVEWRDFDESKEFRQPGFDYVYENTILDVALEHTRTLRERHRLRLLAHYVDQQAQSRGYNEHDYNRTDILGGVFYEYLWPNSGLTFAYAFGQPDIVWDAADPDDDYIFDEYTDKIIAGWRFAFSDDAQVRISISHEVSEKGFGGGAVQFQMFF